MLPLLIWGIYSWASNSNLSNEYAKQTKLGRSALDQKPPNYEKAIYHYEQSEKLANQLGRNVVNISTNINTLKVKQTITVQIDEALGALEKDPPAVDEAELAYKKAYNLFAQNNIKDEYIKGILERLKTLIDESKKLSKKIKKSSGFFLFKDR